MADSSKKRSHRRELTSLTPKTPNQLAHPHKKPKYQDIGIDKLLLGAENSPSKKSKASSKDALDIETLNLACKHLANVDEKLAPLIDLHGPPERLLAKTSNNCFATLSKSIVFQQLATAAAAKIFGRVLDTCGCKEEGFLNPQATLKTSTEDLCKAGLSSRKASYLHDLAHHFEIGMLSDDIIVKFSAEELHTSLTRVKGLGPWSVDMFAMFHLGRPDVFPLGDLGVRKGMMHLYGLSEESPQKMEKIAEKWKPYRSVGSYFMWRVEVPKKRKSPTKGRFRVLKPIE